MTLELDRRHLLGAAAAMAGGAALPAFAAGGKAPDRFVRREGMRLMLGDRPYRFAGTNMWYAAWLGADAVYGDRARLGRELDRLAAMGVTNLRICASGEEGPLKGSIKPGFRGPGPHYNQTLLAGLDYALAEMGKRGLRAVLHLTNFWEWSGGMMTYLSYVNGGRYIDAHDPAHPWPAFANFNAQFYGNAKAVALYHAYVRSLVGRVNTVTGTRYADDGTIVAWQLANEPRPAGDLDHADLPRFYAWIDGTARLIKSIDSDHLVCTGSEGLKGCLEQESIVLAEHRFASIDYLTCHIWPNNWDWVKQTDLPGTFARGEELTDDYIARHVSMARQLGKPLVIEEFGYPRDGGSNDPKVATTYKDRFYRRIYDAALDDMRAGGPIAGTNFWAWNGEARAQHADYVFHPGDRQYMGDPPHEPQGWYGVFDGDSTVRLIADHAASIARLPA
ncbi:mannan endo-1,4-beta-mannosidase [Sphingomonas gellani]|uniref:mannan endo-1,4-beta-mannosidase n=1 Tax=Sphingomonas gellani TaxID=1166340 RepID=A0A1H8J6P9_9SPHN|nr:cellulase family glycosylhydrolase [Sphingomonas gellani]SEN75867.1 mannan endo-1,4-beta-mannosidase [Sphingomonas gellani]